MKLYSDWDNNDKEFEYLPRIYAHGKLEYWIGYDILTTNEQEVRDAIYNDNYETKELEFEVVNKKGKVKKAIGFIYKTPDYPKPIGLVVDVKDKDSIKDAKLKMQNRKSVI